MVYSNIRNVQTGYNFNMDAALAGQLANANYAMLESFLNNSDSIQSTTITIASGSGNYTATINGVATGNVAYTTSDTVTAGLLAAAINGLSTYNAVRATSSAGVVTVTARVPNQSFTIAVTGTNATLAATQSSTLTIATGSGTISAIINGVTTSVTWATSDASTAAALAAAINASASGATVVATSASGVVTVTARVAYTPFTFSASGTGATAATTAGGTPALPGTYIGFGVGLIYTSTGGVRLPAAGDTAALFAGVSVRNQNIENQVEFGIAQGYPPNRMVSVLQRSDIYVATEGAVNPTLGVQLRLTASTSGSPAGAFASTGNALSGGTTLDISSYARWKTTLSAAGLAILSLNR